MGDLVEVNISNEEVYPVLSIQEAEDGAGHPYAIPVSLLDALQAAEESVESIKAAIMEIVAERHPDAQVAIDWLAERADDLAKESARAAYEAAHPEGPGWAEMDPDERLGLIDAARA